MYWVFSTSSWGEYIGPDENYKILTTKEEAQKYWSEFVAKHRARNHETPVYNVFDDNGDYIDFHTPGGFREDRSTREYDLIDPK